MNQPAVKPVTAPALLTGSSWIRLAFCLSLLLWSNSCTSSEKPPIHLNPNMDNQPKSLPQSESRFFYDGATMRRPVEGTIARGDLQNAELENGKNGWGFYLSEIPIQVNDSVLARGRQRFGVYCRPCHGASGDGQGVLWERAGIQTADLLTEDMRRMPAGRLFEVISNGSGLMPAYRHPLPAADRWAIAAYLKQLQREANGREN